MTQAERNRDVTIVAAFLIVVFSVALVILQANIGESQNKALYAACRGGNLRSAYELANHSDGPRRRSLAEDVLPIIDCDKLVQEGERQAVSLEVQKQYVALLSQARVFPIIENGIITHTETLPGLAPR